ncbi:MAG: type II toxin-antitoxin system RelE/ParE family toxin [Cyanobacteria bacterium J06600_6]
MIVKEYIREDKSHPFREWFNTLDAQTAVKVAVATARLEQDQTSSIQWFDCIGEYKINWGSGYKIYFAKDGEELIILLFGVTDRNKQKENVNRAIKLYQEYKHRKE